MYKRRKQISLTKNKILVNHPTEIYRFKINNRNTRKICEICSKSTIKTTERRQTPF